MLGALPGLRFAVLRGGRSHCDDLDALPRSLMRLSIGKQAKSLPLAALRTFKQLRELQLDTPGASDVASLPALHTLAWVRATSQACDFILAQEKLRELALHSSLLSPLPPLPKLERLLLFHPRKGTTLDGIDRFVGLRFLRVDRPNQLARLGALRGLRKLETILLVGAHNIADLSDLTTAPKLRTLGLTLSKLDRPTLAALSVLPLARTPIDWSEPTLFDF